MANPCHLDPVLRMLFDQINTRNRYDAKNETDERRANEGFHQSLRRHCAREGQYQKEHPVDRDSDQIANEDTAPLILLTKAPHPARIDFGIEPADRPAETEATTAAIRKRHSGDSN